jgi:hypothetical protein
MQIGYDVIYKILLLHGVAGTQAPTVFMGILPMAVTDTRRNYDIFLGVYCCKFGCMARQVHRRQLCSRAFCPWP